MLYEVITDVACYDLTVCGSTIWCTGEATTSCLDDSDCGAAESCDTINRNNFV